MFERLRIPYFYSVDNNKNVSIRVPVQDRNSFVFDSQNIRAFKYLMLQYTYLEPASK